MSNRIQREVEELLDKLEKFPPKRPLSARIGGALTAPFRAVLDFVSGITPRVTAGHVLLAGLAIIVIAYVLGGTQDIWRWVIVLGFVIFIGAFLSSLRRQSSGPKEKYWRDKPLDLRQRGSWWDNWRNKRR
jgi:hypothetical protein